MSKDIPSNLIIDVDGVLSTDNSFIQSMVSYLKFLEDMTMMA